MKTFTLIAILVVVSIAGATAQIPYATAFKAGSQLPQPVSSNARKIVFPKHYGTKSPGSRSVDSVNSRLVASVNYNVVSVFSRYPIDSFYNTYTGDHGGNGPFSTLYYTKTHQYNYINNTLGYDSNVAIANQTFDSNDSIASSVLKKWDSFRNSYLYSDSESFSYQITGATHAIAYITIPYDTTGNTWAPLANSSKASWSYNSNGAQLTGKQYSYNGTTWVNTIIDTLTYDPFGNNTSVTLLFFNGSKWDTAYSTFYVYQYDGKNQDTTQLELHYDTTKKAYDTAQKTSYTYDAHHLGYDSIATQLLYNQSNHSFSNQSRSIYYYDADNNDTTIISQLWKSGQWLNDVKTLCAFNNYNQLTDLTWRTWNVGLSYWEIGGSYDDKFYYQQYNITTGVQQLPSTPNQLSIYPNPTSNQITITSNQTIKNISIMNVLGQVVLHIPHSTLIKGDVVDVSSLADGLYFVMVTTESGTNTMKFVVSR